MNFLGRFTDWKSWAGAGGAKTSPGHFNNSLSLGERTVKF